MNKMEKPPVMPVSKERQEQQRKQQEALKAANEAEKEKWRKFRADIQSGLEHFMSEGRISLSYPSMDKTRRTIVHDVVEALGLQAFSFGIEDVDRHVVVYKEGHVPCEDELNCLRRGEPYDPEKIALQRQQKLLEEQEQSRRKRMSMEETKTNYKDKYSHLIGTEAGISAAAVAVPNKSFGFVPSENKKDQRSIEQTLKDIQEKRKKRKLEMNDGGPSDDGPSSSREQEYQEYQEEEHEEEEEEEDYPEDDDD